MKASTLPAFPQPNDKSQYLPGTLGGLLELYLQNDSVTRSTKRKYWFVLHRCYGDWLGKQADLLTVFDVRDRYLHLSDTHSKAYAYRSNCVLSAIFRFAIDEGSWFGLTLSRNPAAEANIPSTGHMKKRRKHATWQAHKQTPIDADKRPTSEQTSAISILRSFYAANRKRFVDVGSGEQFPQCGYVDARRSVVFFFDHVLERLFGRPANAVADELNSTGALYRDNSASLRSSCLTGRYLSFVESFLLD